MITLTKTQEEILNKIHTGFQFYNKVALAAFTGAGKTAMAAEIIKRHWLNKKTLFVVRGEKITRKNHEVFFNTFKKNQVGIILRQKKQLRNVSVASIDTILADRDFKNQCQNFFDFIIVDEAHLSTSTNYRDFLEGLNSECKVLGLSATYGLNNKRCHDFWETFIKGPDGFQLVEEGFVPPMDIVAPDFSYNLSNVSTGSNGDYNNTELYNEVCKDTKLFGDIISYYNQYASDKPAIAFCINIKHIEKLKKLFLANGTNIVTFHSKQSGAEKRKNQKLMDYWLVMNIPFLILSVDMLSAGVDIPKLLVGLVLRPTKSHNKYNQQCGRLTRQDLKNPKRKVLLDFTKNWYKFGHPYNMISPVRKKKESKEDDAVKMFRCKECFYVSSKPFTRCPNCKSVKKLELQEKEIKHDKKVRMKIITCEEIMMSRDEIKESLRRARFF